MFRQVRIVAMVAIMTLGCLTFASAQDSKETGGKKQITNSVGMKLVLIPPGEFKMGSPEPAEQLVKTFAAYHREAHEFDDEYPQHRVRISKPFYFGVCAVTVGQFRRFAEDANYKTEAEKDGQGGWGYNPDICRCEGRKPQFNWRNPGFKQTDTQPVLNVTWNDAMAFCQWIGHREREIYRLPSEAEWEYACRAGATTRYFNGNDPDNLAKVAKMTEEKGRSHFPAVQNLVVAKDSGECFTVPVGSFPPNAFGLYDMHGNAWQWCADWYGADYYSKSPTNDPQGPKSGDRRVRRGGAWNSFPLWLRASFRNYNTPVSRCVNLGFRVVRNLSQRD